MLKNVLLILFVGVFLQKTAAQDLEKIKDLKKTFKQKPFDYGGTLSLGLSFYQSNAPIKRNAPYNWIFSGNPWVKIYGVNIPVSITYSETGRSLTNPFRYNFTGASPYYKWVKLHLGFRSMQLGEYTMNGMVFNGAGIELTPKRFRFSAFYGVFNPAVKVDSSNKDFGVILPAYKRIGFGGKIGFGSANNHFDFSIFKGKDVVSSLEEKPSFSIIRPEENLSFGPSLKLLLFKHWLIETEGALSVITRNVLNDTLKQTELINQLDQVQRVNTTTYGAFAGHMQTGLQYDKWGTIFRVKRISGDYRSLGINFIQDDLLEYSVNPNVRLFNNRLMLSGSYGFYRDNVSNKRINTTYRNILNTQVSANLSSKVSVNASYSNFGTTRENGQLQLNDSITFSIINESIMFNINTQVNKNLSLAVFAMTQNSKDRNIFTQKFNNSETYNTGVSSQFSVFKIYKINASINVASFRIYEQTTQNVSLNCGTGRSFFKKKLNLNVTAMHTIRQQKNSTNGSATNLSMRVGVKPNKANQFSLQYRYSVNKTGVVSNQFFNEQRLNIQYAFVF